MIGPIEFKSAVVEPSEDERITLALFDGEPEKACVAILKCEAIAAFALFLALSSVFESGSAATIT
jgi:hypothetical protein